MIGGMSKTGNLEKRPVRVAEPPCTERYARWCGRTAGRSRLLPDIMLRLIVPKVLFPWPFFIAWEAISFWGEGFF
jgi:hypothetical protein